MYKKGGPLNLLTWLKGGYLKIMGAISGGPEKIWNKKQFLLHSPLQLKLWLVPYYNYHKKISQNPLMQFVKKLHDFDNFIRRRMSDHDKITFAIKYLPMSHLR